MITNKHQFIVKLSVAFNISAALSVNIQKLVMWQTYSTSIHAGCAIGLKNVEAFIEVHTKYVNCDLHHLKIQ